MILTIGAKEWPFPIPLVMRNDAWQFDTAAGRTELLYRRIGRNELNTIQAVLAYVDAQNEYSTINPEKSPVPTYAQRIISSPGKKDGLYWPAAGAEVNSPLGDLVARATSEGYRAGARAPYHGYYFKILTSQGATAPGGAVNYVARGRMIGGFGAGRLPGGVRQFRRDDLPRQSRRHDLPEGPGAGHRTSCLADDQLQPGSNLEAGLGSRDRRSEVTSEEDPQVA